MSIETDLKEQWAQYGDDKAPLWKTIVELMDNEIREQVHIELAPCTQKEFFDEYCKRHVNFGDTTQY